jgi:hypothetical protein
MDERTARINTAYEKVELAELSKAMISLLSNRIYSGSPASIQSLFATGRAKDRLTTTMHELRDSPFPEISPSDFAAIINQRTRGGAQAGDGWRMDHIKDINKPPKIIDESGMNEDPLGPLREFCTIYAAGSLPIDEQFYQLLPDFPRPVVVVDIFRRLGMNSVLRECKSSLGQYFGSRREYAVGIQAPGQRVRGRRWESHAKNCSGLKSTIAPLSAQAQTFVIQCTIGGEKHINKFCDAYVVTSWIYKHKLPFTLGPKRTARGTSLDSLISLLVRHSHIRFAFPTSY